MKTSDAFSAPTVLPKPLAPPLRNVFASPQDGSVLTWEHKRLIGAAGDRYPIVRGIPRFVEASAYDPAAGLDAAGATTGEDDFHARTGLTPKDVRSKLVLDAGIGAERAADVLSRWGAYVVSVGSGLAVEAEHRNLFDRDTVVVAQANIGSLPFRLQTFDLIVVGDALRLAPDPQRAVEVLVSLLKPGGRIAVCLSVQAVRSAAPARPGRLAQIFGNIFPAGDGRPGAADATTIHSAEAIVGWFADADLTDIVPLPDATAVNGTKPHRQDEANEKPRPVCQTESAQ